MKCWYEYQAVGQLPACETLAFSVASELLFAFSPVLTMSTVGYRPVRRRGTGQSVLFRNGLFRAVFLNLSNFGKWGLGCPAYWLGKSTLLKVAEVEKHWFRALVETEPILLAETNILY